LREARSERAHDRSDAGRDGRRRKADSKISDLSLACLAGRQDRFLGAGDHSLRVLDEDGSRLRQLDTAAGSIEEFDAELLLELPDLLAEGGLGDVFTLGGTAKMQLRRRGSRKPQLAKLDK
jgi:hypothetical protein